MSSLTGGTLRFALAQLAALPRAAVVVEDRYSAIFKLDRVRPAVVADGLAELQVRWPTVALVFCETRPLAEEWTYRYLAAAQTWQQPSRLPWSESASQPASSTTLPPPLNPPLQKSVPGPAPTALPCPPAANCDQKCGTAGEPPTLTAGQRSARWQAVFTDRHRHYRVSAFVDPLV